MQAMSRDQRAVGRSLPGRGAASNPANRFEGEERLPDPEQAGQPPSQTTVISERVKTALSYNDSPDIGFDRSLNPYRGCEHGCVYCYARPTHEYFGLSAGLDFETKLFAKTNIDDVLRQEVAAPRYRPRFVALSGVTDPYQPVEKHLELTRRCLNVLAESGHPVEIITKNPMVTRDVDLLRPLARQGAVRVSLSVTSLRGDLARRLEPRVPRPDLRLAAVSQLAAAGVPVGVNISPIIPGLNDEEVPALIRAARDAGAQWVRWILLRLPHGVKGVMAEWLEAHYPDRAAKVLNKVREARGGQLNVSQFGERMRGSGQQVAMIRRLFQTQAEKAGLSLKPPPLSALSFRAPSDQLQLL